MRDECAVSGHVCGLSRQTCGESVAASAGERQEERQGQGGTHDGYTTMKEYRASLLPNAGERSALNPPVALSKTPPPPNHIISGPETGLYFISGVTGNVRGPEKALELARQPRKLL